MSLSAVGLDVDLGGITRQITRDDRPAAVLAVEPEPRTWAWALEHLVAPDSVRSSAAAAVRVRAAQRGAVPRARARARPPSGDSRSTAARALWTRRS